VNSHRTNFCYWGSLHAEIDALRKVKKKIGKPQKLNMIVIRINKLGELGMSKPCVNCIKKIEKFQEYKNIRITSIYFSESSQEITKVSLEKLKKMIPHKSRGYRRK
jgi:hypothetical protein